MFAHVWLTSKTCPQCASTYTISLVLKVFPFAFAVMERKTTEAYRAAAAALREEGTECQNILTYWEQAEREGTRLEFSDLGVSMWGCTWHFTKVMCCKVKSLKTMQHGLSGARLYLILIFHVLTASL